MTTKRQSVYDVSLKAAMNNDCSIKLTAAQYMLDRISIALSHAQVRAKLDVQSADRLYVLAMAKHNPP